MSHIPSDILSIAVELSEMMKDAKEWEDWDGEEATLVPRRSEEEENYLWSM